MHGAFLVGREQFSLSQDDFSAGSGGFFFIYSVTGDENKVLVTAANRGDATGPTVG